MLNIWRKALKKWGGMMMNKEFDFHDFVKDSKNERFQVCLVLSCEGDSSSQNWLGYAYYTGGFGLEPNIEKAVYWLKKSAAQYDENAMHTLEEIGEE